MSRKCMNCEYMDDEALVCNKNNESLESEDWINDSPWWCTECHDINFIIKAMNLIISHCNYYLKNAKCEGCPFDGSVCGLARIPSGWEIPEVKK